MRVNNSGPKMRMVIHAADIVLQVKLAIVWTPGVRLYSFRWIYWPAYGARNAGSLTQPVDYYHTMRIV